jgi:hypothetical protein
MTTPAAHAADDAPSDEHLVINVDNKEFRVHDPKLTGRQILEIAGKRSVDDYIVYWLAKNNVLQDLGLEKTVHIHKGTIERFLTFRNDRSYRFEIDGKREDWGAPSINEATLRMLAAVGEDHRIYLELKDQPDRLIERGEFVDLAGSGIERFYSERDFTITIVNEDNGHEFRLHGRGRDTISRMIDEMYKVIGVPRRDDDRLRCEQGGGDVFTFEKLTLAQYVEAGHCKCLVWLFAGGTGGAACP